MGREKDKGLRKAKPAASSAAAAAMVASMGGGGMGLSFAAFDPKAESIDYEVDSEIAIAIRKLSKKDSTTKIKALSDLCGYCEEGGGKDDQQIEAALTLWEQHFEIGWMDPDRRVREGLFAAHKAICGRVKKQVGRRIKAFMYPWLCARFDPEVNVRTAANLAFSGFFPQNKVGEALVFCKGEISRSLEDVMRHSVQTLCDPKSYTKEEAEETFARIISTSVLALSHIVEILEPGLAVPFLSSFKIFSGNQFWKYLGHQDVHIRSAMYTFVTAVTTKTPKFVEEYGEDTDKKLLAVLSPLVLQSLADKDPASHVQLWECLLTFSKTFPSCFQLVNVRKAVLPRFFSHVKSAAHGSCLTSYPCFVPFADLCAGASEGSTQHVYLELQAAIAESFVLVERSEEMMVVAVRTYFECVLQCLLHCTSKLQGEETADVVQKLLEAPLATILGSGMLQCRPEQLVEPMAKCVKVVMKHQSVACMRPHVLKMVGEHLVAAAKALSVVGEGDGKEEDRLIALSCALGKDNSEREIEEILSKVSSLLLSCYLDAPGTSSPNDRLRCLKVVNRLFLALGIENLVDGQRSDKSARLRLVEELFVRVNKARPLSVVLADSNDEELFSVSAMFALMIDFVNRVDKLKAVDMWKQVLLEVQEGAAQVKVEALILVLEAVNQVRSAAAAPSSPFWCCRDFDELVLREFDALVGMGEEEMETGMHRSSLLRSLLFLSLGCLDGAGRFESVLGRMSQGGAGGVLISEGGVESLYSKVSLALKSCADGRMNRSSALAVLDITEIILSKSKEALHVKDSELAEIVDGVCALRMHTEGDADDDAAASFDHDELTGQRLRSRVGVRATSLWAKEGRRALKERLREDKAALLWVEKQTGWLRAAVNSLTSRNKALLLADQAHELMSVARDSKVDFSLRAISTWDEQALGRGENVAVTLFVMRFLHLTLSHHQEDLPLNLPMLESLIFTFASSRTSAPPLPPFLQSRYQEIEGLFPQHMLDMQDKEDDGSFRRDLERFWDQLVAPVLLKDAGGRELHASVTRTIVKDSLAKLRSGETLWAAALTHVYHLLAQLPASRFLTFCDLLADLHCSTDCLLEDVATRHVEMLAVCQVLSPLSFLSHCLLEGAKPEDKLFYLRNWEHGGGERKEEEEEEKEVNVVAVRLVEVHRQEFPPFFTIREEDGRERQTESFRLFHPKLFSSKPLQQAAMGQVEGWEEEEEEQNVDTWARCVRKFARTLASIHKEASKSVMAIDRLREEGVGEAETLALLALECLAEMNRFRVQGVGGEEGWRALFAHTCSWWRREEAIDVPVPESCYMLASSKGLLLHCDHLLLAFQHCSFHKLRSSSASLAHFWYRLLLAEPDGGRVRGASEELRAFSRMVLAVGQWMTGEGYRGTTEQGFAMLLLSALERWVVKVGDFPEGSEEAAEFYEGGGEEEVIEVEEEAECEEVGEKEGEARQLQPSELWTRIKTSCFAHLLGDLVTARDHELTSFPPPPRARLRLIAHVSRSAPMSVLQLSLVHLIKRKRQSFCEALHTLLSSSDVLVQLTAYALLSKFYVSDSLLGHLDGLAWEGLKVEEEENSATSSREEQPADELRCLPLPLVTAMQTHLQAKEVMHETLMSTVSLCGMLAWKLALDLRRRCPPRYQANISAWLRQTSMLHPFLDVTFAHLTLDAPASWSSSDMNCETLPPLDKLLAPQDCISVMERLAGHLFLESFQAFPALVRMWYNQLDRASALSVESFVSYKISPILLAREIAVVCSSSIDKDELSIRASASTREIAAAYSKDEAVMEVILRVPELYPLRVVEVEGTRRVGISEGKWKKWALSMRTLLDNKDGSLLDAILLWKKNVDQVFEGVEECPICYTVIHMVNNSLPTLSCHTCRNKFHSACLYKWFNTSNKSTCPLCQTPWYS